MWTSGSRQTPVGLPSISTETRTDWRCYSFGTEEYLVRVSVFLKISKCIRAEEQEDTADMYIVYTCILYVCVH